MASQPRERLIQSAIVLVREHGVQGTGLAELLSHSKTARGSIYQHFPGGKTELIEEATREAGRQISALLESLAAGRQSPSEVIDALVGWWQKALEASGFTLGCPIGAAALADAPEVRGTAAGVFSIWRQQLADALTNSGLDRDRAAPLAGFVVSAFEGAIVQSRAMRSVEPFDEVRHQLGELLRAYG